MRLPRSADIIGLAVLAAAAVVLAVLAVIYVRPVPASVTAAPPASAQRPSSDPLPTAEKSPASPPSTPPSTSSSIPPTPNPGPGSGEGTQSESAQGSRELLSTEGAVVSVLGDGSGNADDEWVAQWSRELAEDRAVTYRSFDADAGDYRLPESQSAAGSALQVWNGSRADDTAAAIEESLIQLQPEAPDLVVISLGHAESAEGLGQRLDDLLSTIIRTHPDAGVVVVLQNPAVQEAAEGQQKKIDIVRDWAEETGTPTVDVRSAFEGAEASVAEHLYDDSFPNQRGSELWAETVARWFAP